MRYLPLSSFITVIREYLSLARVYLKLARHIFPDVP